MKKTRLASIFILFITTLALNFSEVFGKVIIKESAANESLAPVNAYSRFTISPDGVETRIDENNTRPRQYCVIVAVLTPLDIVSCAVQQE